MPEQYDRNPRASERFHESGTPAAGALCGSCSSMGQCLAHAPASPPLSVSAFPDGEAPDLDARRSASSEVTDVEPQFVFARGEVCRQPDEPRDVRVMHLRARHVF